MRLKGGVVLLMAGLAITQTKGDDISGTLTVAAVISDGCQVDNVNVGGGSNDYGLLDFGTLSSLASFNDAIGGGSGGVGFQITCTNGLSYSIGLNTGLNDSAGQRRMSNGSDFIVYDLYRDASRSQPWGAVGSGNELTSTGTGVQQAHIVFGRIPPSATPPSGNYSDTVQVTISW